MENKKDIIVNLFYERHMKVKDIASFLEVSSVYVTKIIKTDVRYDDEKLARRNATVERHREVSRVCMKRLKEQRKCDDSYYIMQVQHRQAVSELSGRTRLDNERYRSWNSSAYIYCPSKSRYDFDKSLGRSADVPKYIKV